MASETVMVEAFNQGLVNVRHPTALRPGELAALDDMIYRPNDHGVWRAPGRNLYGTVVSQTIVASGTAASPTLTSASLFGTNIASVTTVLGDAHLFSTSAFGSVQVGQTVWGTGIPANARVQRVLSSSLIQLDKSMTATGTITATFSNLWAGMFLSNTNLPVGTQISSITNASTIVMTQNAIANFTNANVVFSASVKGLRYIQFDPRPTPSDNFLIAYSGANYYSSVFSAESGSFSQLAYVGDGPTLDIVHYGNRHYALNGNTQGVPNQTIKGSTGTPLIRRHGLAPVDQAPSLAVTNLANSWTVFASGFYWYLSVEVAKYVDPTDVVESTFTGTPSNIFVTAPNQYVTVTRNPTGGPINPEANFWRVYRAGPTQGGDTSYQPPLSSFVQVSGDIPIANATWNDSSITTLTSTAFNTGTNVSNWNAAANISLQDGLYAYTAISGAVMHVTTPTLWSNGAPGGSTVGIIIGLVVGSVGYPNYPAIQIRLSWNNGVSWTQPKTVGPFLAKAPKVVSLGGQNDPWGRSWLAADFNPGNLMIEVTCLTPQLPPNSVTTLLDYITMNVYQSNSTQFQNQAGLNPFPVVTVTVSPITTVYGAHGEPPTASTGDIFNGQLVLNDVSDASIVRYSLPDNVEYFPFPYFLNFETKEADIVTCIRRIGDKLVVGLQYQIYAVNYLPRETDAEFDRGRAYEAISERHGIVGPQAFALFAPPGEPQMGAYVSQENIHQTDGFRTTTITEDIDWPNMVELSRINQCVLVDYAKLSSLVLFYTPKGGTENTRALWFSYHPSHIKEGGKMLVSGPTVVRAGSSHIARLNLDWIFLTGHNRDGNVYVEDRGAYDNSNLAVGINPRLRTREMLLAGVGYESTVEKTWVHKSKAAPVMTIQSQPWRHMTNNDPYLILPPKALKTLTTTFDGLSRLEQHFDCEAAFWEFTCPDAGAGLNSAWKLNFMAFEVAGHGLENTGGGTP